MIPRGLAVSVGAGAVLAAVLGMILIDLKGAQLEFVDGASLSLVTDGTDFKKGQAIPVRIVNSGTIPLSFPDTSYGTRVTQLDGIAVYSAGRAESALGPSEENLFVWHQIKDGGEEVLHGTYRIVTEALAADQTRLRESVTINIFR